jgi:hypothetical protein
MHCSFTAYDRHCVLPLRLSAVSLASQWDNPSALLAVLPALSGAGSSVPQNLLTIVSCCKLSHARSTYSRVSDDQCAPTNPIGGGKAFA